MLFIQGGGRIDDDLLVLGIKLPRSDNIFKLHGVFQFFGYVAGQLLRRHIRLFQHSLHGARPIPGCLDLLGTLQDLFRCHVPNLRYFFRSLVRRFIPAYIPGQVRLCRRPFRRHVPDLRTGVPVRKVHGYDQRSCATDDSDCDNSGDDSCNGPCHSSSHSEVMAPFSPIRNTAIGDSGL